MATRTDRELETRDATKRKQHWVRPGILPTPNPRDGWEHHWVRVAMQGQDDAPNISSRLREGWVPCKAEDYPEIPITFVENRHFKDNIVFGGLMLCRAPVEMVEERNAFYRKQSEAQMRTVDETLMRENNPKMPLFAEKSSKVTFGKGN